MVCNTYATVCSDNCFQYARRMWILSRSGQTGVNIVCCVVKAISVILFVEKKSVPVSAFRWLCENTVSVVSATHRTRGKLFERMGATARCNVLSTKRLATKSGWCKNSNHGNEATVRIRHLKYKEEQIIETRDKPQHLATQRLLSCLQYPDATKSSTKDLSLPPSNLKISWK